MNPELKGEDSHCALPGKSHGNQTAVRDATMEGWELTQMWNWGFITRIFYS